MGGLVGSEVDGLSGFGRCVAPGAMPTDYKDLYTFAGMLTEIVMMNDDVIVHDYSVKAFVKRRSNALANETLTNSNLLQRTPIHSRSWSLLRTQEVKQNKSFSSTSRSDFVCSSRRSTPSRVLTSSPLA